MDKKIILFLALNNGSEIRIRKELESMSHYCDLIYMGMGYIEKNDNFQINNVHYININRSHKNIFNIFLYLSNFIKIISKNSFDSLHIVNEELYILLFPILLILRLIKKTYIVLDVFDSFLLKNNISPKKLNKFLFKIYFSQFDKLILTDQDRLKIYPDFIIKGKNAVTVENYPKREALDNNLKLKNEVNIGYIGNLSKLRGSKFLNNLLEKYSNIRITSMGTIYDEYTEFFLKKDRINFYGNLSSFEMNKILLKDVHYLLLYYPPISLNNLYSSPNKLFDAINLNIPILINKETYTSKFITLHSIGLSFELDKMIDNNFLNKMMDNHSKYKKALKKLKNQDIYNWESIQSKLIKSHKLEI